MNERTRKWIKATVVAMLCGGFTASIRIALDPTQYRWPHDIGTGKLLIHFLGGAGITFLAMGIGGKK